MDCNDSSPALDTIETLLQNRHGADLLAHEAEIESLAKVISGVADADTRARVDRHLEGCAECREVLLTLQRTDNEETSRHPMPKERRDRHSRFSVTVQRSAIAAAAVLLVAFTWLFSTWVGESPSDMTDMGLKGEDDNLTVVVGRGASRYVLGPLATLKENDQLGLFYSATRPGYLLVVALDASGTTSMLFPANALQSAEIKAGENVSLPDGALVEAGSGCEWLIGVFSDEPIGASDVRKAVAQRVSTEHRCGIDIELKAARTVKILRFVR